MAFDYLCSFYFFGLGSLSVYFLCKKCNFVELERENQCLFAYSRALCSVVLSYSLESSLKVNNITVRKEMAVGRTLLVL